MTNSTIEESQRKAARVVGFTYLLAMVAAIFEFSVRAHLTASNNGAEIARNIMAHGLLFRLSIASEVIVFATDIVLITALYVVLKPVNQNLALLAAFWRLIETAILAVTALGSFDILRLLSGADYLGVFEADRLQALARLDIGAYGAGYNVGFVFLGLGSTVFCYLWFKSNYIPRVLAALGVFGSLVLALCSFTFIIFPSLTKILFSIYMAPMGVFEVGIGLWLLIKGLRPYRIARPEMAKA